MLAKSIARLFCFHHNKIQFVGYEVANLVLIAHHAKMAAGSHSYVHMAAAFAFLCGSACIFFFDPKNRAPLLFSGGIALTTGGIFLIAAGYPVTGSAVVLASLETSRGGLDAWRRSIADGDTGNPAITSRTRLMLIVGKTLLLPYTAAVVAVCGQFNTFGTFIENRPFLTSALIKFPMRLDMIARQVLQGDLIGAGVGLSWMLLGDGALAFNDQPLKQRVLRWAAASRSMPRRVGQIGPAH